MPDRRNHFWNLLLCYEKEIINFNEENKMLQCLDKSADTIKRAYTSFLDLAAIPFVYNLWYDQSIFESINAFSYIYLSGCMVSFVAKEIVQKYKEANPDLTFDDYNNIIKIVDSVFKGVSETSGLLFPAIILDIIFHIRSYIPKGAIQIIHPTFIGTVCSYGAYKGLEHYGLFKCMKVPVEVIEEQDALVSSSSSRSPVKFIKENKDLHDFSTGGEESASDEKSLHTTISL